MFRQRAQADSIARPPEWFVSTPRLLLLAAVLGAVLLVPVAIYPYPYLQDFPNHLARIHIALHLDDVLLSRHYEVVRTLVPNLGWDIVMSLLGRVFALETAGKLYVVLVFAVTGGGAFALHRALTGRISPLPLLLAPFLYNDAYTQGFLSFILGFGLALWAMAAWLLLASRHRAVRLAVATVSATILCVVHVYAFATYGFFLAALTANEAVRDGNWRKVAFYFRAGHDALQVVPALVLLSMSALARHGGPTHAFRWPHEKLEEIYRLIHLGPTVVSVLFLLAASLLLLAFLIRTRAWPERPAIVAGCAFLGVFFVMPGVLFGAYNADWRLLLPAGGVLALGCRPRQPLTGKETAGLLAGLSLLVIVMAAYQVKLWRTVWQAQADFHTLIAPLPRGASLFWSVSDPQTMRHIEVTIPGMYHIASDAVRTKHALVSTTFAIPGQHLLRLRDPALQNLAGLTSIIFLPEIAQRLAASGIDFKRHIMRFDYVVLFGLATARERVVLPWSRLRLINRVGRFRLFEVARD